MKRYKFYRLRRFLRRLCPFKHRLLCEIPCFQCGVCEPIIGCMGCIRTELHQQGRCRDLEHK